MNEGQALEMIKAALVEVAGDRSDDFADIRPAMTIEELNLDSVTTMEMVGLLEEQLDTVFPDEELPHVNTMADIVSLILHGKVRT
ncbi:MAG: acyl carrier protein [Alphaproteobacteria bacterium]|nr:acyl carrier protein [Alphaproteobacteria bacterium]